MRDGKRQWRATRVDEHELALGECTHVEKENRVAQREMGGWDDIMRPKHLRIGEAADLVAVWGKDVPGADLVAETLVELGFRAEEVASLFGRLRFPNRLKGTVTTTELFTVARRLLVDVDESYQRRE